MDEINSNNDKPPTLPDEWRKSEGGGGGLGEKLFFQRQLTQGLTAQLRGSEELSHYALPSLMDSFLKRNNIEGMEGERGVKERERGEGSEEVGKRE
jgi:hypothetical protein